MAKIIIYNTVYYFTGFVFQIILHSNTIIFSSSLKINQINYSLKLVLNSLTSIYFKVALPSCFIFTTSIICRMKTCSRFIIFFSVDLGIDKARTASSSIILIRRKNLMTMVTLQIWVSRSIFHQFYRNWYIRTQ